MLALLLASLAPLAPAQQARSDVSPAPNTQAWRVDSFAREAGLSEGFVLQAAVAEDGTAWFATSSGLLRYHGTIWERFTTRDGLPSDFVRAVTITRDGVVWIGTDQGAGRFEDDRFRPTAPPERLAGPSVRRIVEGPDGTLWLCCDRWPIASVHSGLTALSDEGVRHYTSADGLPSDYVSDVVFDSDGELYVLTGSGLAQRVGERFRQPLVEAGLPGASDYAWSLVEPAPGQLLLATTRSYFLRSDGAWRRVGEAVEDVRNPALVRSADGEVLALRQSRPAAFVRWAGAGFEPATEPFPWTGLDVQDLVEAPDGAIWCVGGGLLLRWDRGATTWTVFEDLPPPALVDEAGGVWFAGPERVLRRAAEQWWTFPGASTSVVPGSAGSVWLSAGRAALRWTSDGSTRVSAEVPPGVELERLLGEDASGTLWALGADAQSTLALGLVGGRWESRSLAPRGAAHPQLALDPVEGGLWATQGSGLAERLLRVGAGPLAALEVELPAAARLVDPPAVMRTSDGALWIHGFFGALRRASPTAAEWEPIPGLAPQHIGSSFERGDALWLLRHATTGGRPGLSLRLGGRWSHLDLDFRHLVGWGADDGPIFVQADRLLFLRSDSLQVQRVVKLRDPRDIDRVVVDGDGALWLWNGHDVLRVRDDGQPPDTTLLELAWEVPQDSEGLGFRVRGYERFRPVDRSGGFHAQARLDGGAWKDLGELGEGAIQLPVPDVGRHELAVRVVNSFGVADPTPAVASFRVLPVPLQTRGWFRPLATGLIAALLGLSAFGLAARSRLAQQARALARLVEERTLALQGREVDYRTLLEESRDAIVLCDGRGGVADANRAAQELFGFAPQELRRACVAQLFDAPLDLERACDPGAAPLRLTRGDGSRHVFLSATQRRDEQGSPSGYLLIARDVTRMVQLEEHLSHRQKMEAIGRMAGGVAHEFNNVLTVILGYCELVADRVTDLPEVRRDVDLVREQAQRAIGLTGQIQVFSRADLGRPQVIEVNQVVARSERLLRPALQPDVRLEVRLDPRVGRARIEAGKLEQVVVNLVLNAVDALPGSGRVTVATGVGAGAAGGETWTLTVSDTGSGMNEETRRKIFEPFFTTKPPGRGTGLGLAIVYGIVDRAGGTIEVSSAPGLGSQFRVSLPATEDPVVAAPSTDRPAGARRGCERVLVVDDEAPIRALLRTLLEREGYSVATAADASEARRLRAEAAAGFDLLISDLVMPGTSGRALADDFQRLDPDLRVLLISGQPDLDGLEAIARRPRLAFLPKPFAPRDLLERARRLLDGQPRSASACAGVDRA